MRGVAHSNENIDLDAWRHSLSTSPHELGAALDEDPIGEMRSVASYADVSPPDQEFIIEDNLPVGAATTMFGDGGVGKTLAAMQMGVSVEQGRDVFGFRTRKGRVHGYFCEDTDGELQRRFRSICLISGIPQSAVEGFIWQSRFGRESLLGVFDEEGAFKPAKLLEAITKRAVEDKARLVILDNILHLYPGNVNDPGA